MDEPDPAPPQGPVDVRAAHDALRDRCALARDDTTWIVLRHAEVVAAATDPATFSSRVSARRAIPNSLDGDEHTAYRAVVDRYLTDDRVDREEGQCRRHAAALVDGLPRGTSVEAIADLGLPYAVRAQSTWLGWPPGIEDDLMTWVDDHHAATAAGDRGRMHEVAERFDHIVQALLARRRNAPARDVMNELLHDQVGGRPLTDAEIVSILRNWTAGDLGSLARSVGVLVHQLAASPDIQEQVRSHVRDADAQAVTAAVLELLRVDDPFVSNRRVTARRTELAGITLDAGTTVVLSWVAADRDPRVFTDPDRYDPVRNASANLVFGAGPHACPGRSLTLMELGVVVEELLGRTAWLEPSHRAATRNPPPVGGWSHVPVVLR